MKRKFNKEFQFPAVMVVVPLYVNEPVRAYSFASMEELVDASGLERHEGVQKHTTAFLETCKPYHWARAAWYRNLLYDADHKLITLRGLERWPDCRRLDAERSVRKEARKFIGKLRLDISPTALTKFYRAA